VILKAMDDLDPQVKLDDPGNEASKAYILALPTDPEMDYPQVFLCHFLKFSMFISFQELYCLQFYTKKKICCTKARVYKIAKNTKMSSDGEMSSPPRKSPHI
jgi:hypothetical protein